MKRHALIGSLVVLLVGAHGTAGTKADEPIRELSVHLAQANNDSPYAFIRAKFEPGELSDPWAVRFFNQQGQEVPYFVWDSLTWKTAREGRADWGRRFAALNHHPGDAPEARQMRSRRLEPAQEQLPELGATLAARHEATKRAGHSVCAALYLVRYTVPALSKDKLTLRVYGQRQVEPNRRVLKGERVTERIATAAGELVLSDLPDQIVLRWKGKALLRDAGFAIGDKSAGKDGSIRESTHADRARPFEMAIEEGIITKVRIKSQTSGRNGAPMNWQSTYWLFPEGSFVSLVGFSFENTDDYLGGGLSLACWETARQPNEVHAPTWERPWWLHQTGDVAFAATHQFPNVPLAVGYGNNPFNASPPDSLHVSGDEKTKGQGDGVLGLSWQYDLTDRRLYRLFHPLLDSDGSYKTPSRSI